MALDAGPMQVVRNAFTTKSDVYDDLKALDSSPCTGTTSTTWATCSTRTTNGSTSRIPTPAPSGESGVAAPGSDLAFAWAEVWVDALGWVGFDVSNGISPVERYVRVATGLEYRAAGPISGVRYGTGGESLEVELHIRSGREAEQQ